MLKFHQKTNPMIITAFAQFRPNSHQEPCNEAGSLSPTKYLMGFNQLPSYSNSQYNSGKEYENFIRNAVHSIICMMQRDNNAPHQNWKGQSSLTDKLRICQSGH